MGFFGGLIDLLEYEKQKFCQHEWALRGEACKCVKCGMEKDHSPSHHAKSNPYDKGHWVCSACGVELEATTYTVYNVKRKHNPGRRLP